MSLRMGNVVAALEGSGSMTQATIQDLQSLTAGN